MNNVGFNAGSKITTETLYSNGVKCKHMKFSSNTPLNNERGVSQLWYYPDAKGGETMLSLEGEKGKLIREFQPHQKEQIKNYFRETNAIMNDGLKIKRAYNNAWSEIKEIQIKCNEHIKRTSVGKGDYDYEVNNKAFGYYDSALKELAACKPELATDIDRYFDLKKTCNEMWDKIYRNPYV